MSEYKIKMVENGYALESLNEGFNMVFEMQDESMVDPLVDLLWYLNSVLINDSKYTRNRVQVIKEIGEKYELQEDEVLVMSKYYRVRKKDEKLEYGETVEEEDATI